MDNYLSQSCIQDVLISVSHTIGNSQERKNIKLIKDKIEYEKEDSMSNV